MRVFLLWILAVSLSACQEPALTWLDLNQSPLIEVTVVDLSGQRSQHYVPLHTPLEYFWDALACEKCDMQGFNPAQKLKDQDVLVQVEKIEQRISINHGSLVELQRLPGIGPSLAQRIIDHRTQFGLFQNLEDIMRVRGIKTKLFEKIKAYIRL